MPLKLHEGNWSTELAASVCVSYSSVQFVTRWRAAFIPDIRLAREGDEMAQA